MSLTLHPSRLASAAPPSSPACICADCGRETWLPIRPRREGPQALARCRRCFRAARSVHGARPAAAVLVSPGAR